MTRKTGDSGVYEIANRVNGHRYVGSSTKGINKRFYEHVYHLRRETHANEILTRAFVRYGEDAFEWKVLEYCPPEDCVRVEQEWIDRLNPEYNIARVAGNTLGTHRGPEAKAKMSRIHKGKTISQEQRRKTSLALTGRKAMPFTPEHCAKIAAAKRGVPNPKLSLTRKGKHYPKLSAALRGIGRGASRPWRGVMYRWHMSIAKRRIVIDPNLQMRLPHIDDEEMA